MVGMDVDFDKAQELSSLQVYCFIKPAIPKNRRAQAIYMLGPAWRRLDIIEKLEGDLGVPMVHAIPAQCWDIQRHLTLRQPVQGFGRLVAQLPSGVTISTRPVAPKQAAKSPKVRLARA
jgi:maleate isomerase